MKMSKYNGEHYIWGDKCDGWFLLKADDLCIIQEKMPPDTAEVRHFHQRSKQFFFILKGQATMELDGEIFTLNEQEGIEIPQKAHHKMMNKSDAETEFVVVSSPTSKGDRVVLE